MPYTNHQVARAFENLAEVLEIKKELIFKIRAYRRAAQAVRELPQSLEEMVHRGQDLQGIPGVGKAIADKIVQLVTTGRIATYEREVGSLAPAVQLLLRVSGMTPKGAWQIAQEAGVSTVDELRHALEQGQLQKLLAGQEAALAALRGLLYAGAGEGR